MSHRKVVIEGSFRAGCVVSRGRYFVDIVSGSAAASHGSLASLSFESSDLVVMLLCYRGSSSGVMLAFLLPLRVALLGSYRDHCSAGHLMSHTRLR